MKPLYPCSGTSMHLPTCIHRGRDQLSPARNISGLLLYLLRCSWWKIKRVPPSFLACPSNLARIELLQCGTEKAGSVLSTFSPRGQKQRDTPVRALRFDQSRTIVEGPCVQEQDKVSGASSLLSTVQAPCMRRPWSVGSIWTAFPYNSCLG